MQIETIFQSADAWRITTDFATKSYGRKRKGGKKVKRRKVKKNTRTFEVFYNITARTREYNREVERANQANSSFTN